MIESTPMSQKNAAMSSESVNPLASIATAIPRRFRSVMTSRRFANQKGFAINAGSHHGLRIDKFVEHLARRINVHDSLDVVDRVIVLSFSKPDTCGSASCSAWHSRLRVAPAFPKRARAANYILHRPTRLSTSRACAPTRPSLCWRRPSNPPVQMQRLLRRQSWRSKALAGSPRPRCAHLWRRKMSLA